MNQSATMDRQDILTRLEHEFGLPRETVFFLHLVPLLEVLWADGKSQEAERALVYDYSMRLQRAWAQEAGTEVVSDQALHDFFTRFLHQQPDPATLRGLRDLLLALPMRADSAPELCLDTVLDYCLDIAASAVTHYPYGLRDRVTAPEKALIKELVLQIGAAQAVAAD